MEENSNTGETPERAAPEADSAQEVQVQTESKNDRDWRALRKAKEDLEKEVRLQREINARLMTQPSAPTAPVQSNPDDDILAIISKEEYVPGEKVAKGLQSLERKFEKKLEAVETKYKQKAQVDRYTKLRERFSDLDEVVNPETLAIVAQKDPDLANAWMGLDDYSIAVQAYPYIKNSGILGKQENRVVSEVDKKLDAVKKAPPPSSPAPQQRTMAQAFLMKDPNRDSLYREMTNAAARVNGSY